MEKKILEIAVFSVDGALAAQHAGAHRIEFCENPEEGGTTPSFGALQLLKKKITIPIFPIIRPRGGDFFYSDEEFTIMRQDTMLCRSLGFEGMVTGLLLQDGNIDVQRTKRLVDLAYPMEVTFHRAFDRSIDPLKSLEAVIESGCHRVLTSGQFPSALDGAGLIKKLVEIADDRIIIMPGSGVRSDNIGQLAQVTQANEFHASARIPVKTKMEFVVPSMNESLTYMGVNEAEVKALLSELQKLS